MKGVSGVSGVKGVGRMNRLAIRPVNVCESDKPTSKDDFVYTTAMAPNAGRNRTVGTVWSSCNIYAPSRAPNGDETGRLADWQTGGLVQASLYVPAMA